MPIMPNMPIMPIMPIAYYAYYAHQPPPEQKIKGSTQPATKCASNMLPCLSCIERLPAS